MTWTCFLIEPTERAQESLRRYAMGDCPVNGFYHDASVVIGEVDFPENGFAGKGGDTHPHDDPRWPTACACGYVFRSDDPWQCNRNRLYRHPDESTSTLDALPPGAMYDAPWFADTWHGDDGRCLVLALPDGSPWTIDGPATNGPAWQRSGEPPRITARPSIASPGYHGWLTDGVLSDDLEGRSYA